MSLKLFQITDSLLVEEEPPFSRTRQPDARKSVNEPSSSEFTSRGRGRANKEDHTTEISSDLRRPVSRQEKTSVPNTNLRQQSNNRRSKELNFRPRSELDVNLDSENDFRRSSVSRSRTKSSEELGSNRIRSRYESDSVTTTQSYGRDVSRGSSRVSSRENQLRSRNEVGTVSRNIVQNERKPSLSLTSLSPEDVTFPSRGRSRTTAPSDESYTTQTKVSSRNRNTAGSSRGQARDQNPQTRTFPSRSSISDSSTSRESSRGRGLDNENTGITRSGSRARNENPSVRSKPITEVFRQDVETRFTGRRRTSLDSTKPVTDFPDLSNEFIKSTLPPKDEGKFTITDTQDGLTTQTPLFSSIPVTPQSLEESSTLETTENKLLETNLEPLPTASNDVLISTQLLHSPEEAENVPEKSLVSNTKVDALNKALHARSRGRPSENLQKESSESPERKSSRSNFRNRQRTKESNSESRYSFRERNSRIESDLENRPRVSQRAGTQHNKQSINDKNVQDIKNSFRSRNGAALRHSSVSKETTNQDVYSVTTQPVPLRRSGGSEIDLQTESIPTSKGTLNPGGSRRTLPKLTVEPTKPSRGRGQVKQGGKRDDNEVSK